MVLNESLEACEVGEAVSMETVAGSPSGDWFKPGIPDNDQASYFVSEGQPARIFAFKDVHDGDGSVCVWIREL